MFIVQAYQTSQYVMPRGGIILGKWHSSFAGNSGRKMNVQSACALNTRYVITWIHRRTLLLISYSTVPCICLKYNYKRYVVCRLREHVLCCRYGFLMAGPVSRSGYPMLLSLVLFYRHHVQVYWNTCMRRISSAQLWWQLFQPIVEADVSNRGTPLNKKGVN
jgi:hypothetical protein